MFRLNIQEKGNMQSAYAYTHLNFFYEAVNSHNSETVKHSFHVTFVLHSAMKTHLLTNQNARTIQIIL